VYIKHIPALDATYVCKTYREFRNTRCT